jgi:quercetin dioxygenase-like cupin family protein
MKIEHYTDTPAEPVVDAPGVTIRWVIKKEDGAPNVAMRVIEVEPGANTPYHTHDYEHEVFILAGRGAVRDVAGSETFVEAGAVVFVPPNAVHGFYNRGNKALRFICVIPHV